MENGAGLKIADKPDIIIKDTKKQRKRDFF